MNVGIIDYGMGNLGSVSRAITHLGATAVITDRPERLAEMDRVILPGVGAFADGMAHLEARDWPGAIRAAVAAGTPVLGICLGMHLLAGEGTEGGRRAGLGLIPGVVRRLDAFGCRERIPHVGWNGVAVPNEGALFDGIPTGTDFYFVHSYAFDPGDGSQVLASTQYGVPFTAAIASGATYGTQFHPEKSSKAGFQLLQNFLQRTC